jgi:hypothetical protein
MRKAIVIVATIVIGLVSGVSPGEDTAFDEIVGHYEAIRLGLIEDSNDGVAVNAVAIAPRAPGRARSVSGPPPPGWVVKRAPVRPACRIQTAQGR